MLFQNLLQIVPPLSPNAATASSVQEAATDTRTRFVYLVNMYSLVVIASVCYGCLGRC